MTGRRSVVAALVVAALVVAALAAVGAVWWSRAATEGLDRPVSPAGLQVPAPDTAALAPAGVRVRVQVLNGTGTAGLARRGTQVLRDHGYDVVDFGNRSDRADATQVEVTAASRVWGDRVVRALGTGRVVERVGPLPYVDLVVILGPDWKPAPETLRP